MDVTKWTYRAGKILRDCRDKHLVPPCIGLRHRRQQGAAAAEGKTPVYSCSWPSTASGSLAQQENLLLINLRPLSKPLRSSTLRKASQSLKSGARTDCSSCAIKPQSRPNSAHLPVHPQRWTPSNPPPATSAPPCRPPARPKGNKAPSPRPSAKVRILYILLPFDFIPCTLKPAALSLLTPFSISLQQYTGTLHQRTRTAALTTEFLQASTTSRKRRSARPATATIAR